MRQISGLLDEIFHKILFIVVDSVVLGLYPLQLPLVLGVTPDPRTQRRSHPLMCYIRAPPSSLFLRVIRRSSPGLVSLPRW